RLFRSPNRTPYVKDGIDAFVVGGRAGAVNPARAGTKAAAHYTLSVPGGGSQVIRLRLSDTVPPGADSTAFDAVVHERRCEAGDFYGSVVPRSLDADAANVMRQALGGMLWSKQFYNYDVDRWLAERGSDPFQSPRRAVPRNDRWHHMHNSDVISMPD